MLKQLLLESIWNKPGNALKTTTYSSRETLLLGVQIQGGIQIEAGFPSHSLSYVGLTELKSVRGKARNTAWVQGILPPQEEPHRQGLFQAYFRN